MIRNADWNLKKSKQHAKYFFGFVMMLSCFGMQGLRANSDAKTKIAVETPVQNVVSGTVLDSYGVPLPGANVLVVGTTRGTQTDFDGNFSIEAASNAALSVSYLGYVTQRVSVNGRSSITITMVEDSQALDEVIVTGYTVETKRETTAAVSIVKAEELAAIPSGNIEQQLAGRVAGVTVVTNGQPGTASQIRVRGFGAFGGNEPLYVVDGVPINDISFLNPDDIETTTVLKDAAAASIYGARAANGVIVYTTKQGKRAQKTQISVNIQTGVTDPNVAGSPKMLNPQQMAEYTHLAYENNAAANGTSVVYSHPQYGSNAVPTFPDYLHADGQNGVSASQINLAQIEANYAANPENVFLIKPNLAGTNWYDEITRTAPATRVSLGFNGGTENGRFYAGLSMQSLDGILLSNSQDRYTARFNSEFDLTPWLSVGENFQATYNSVRGQSGGNGGLGISNDESEILSAYRMPTIFPVFDEFGSYASTRAAGFNNPRNPVRRLVQDRQNDQNWNASAFGNLYALLKPVEGLTFRTSIGGSYFNTYSLDYNYRYLGDSEPQASFSFYEGSQYGFQWIWTNSFNYEKTFGKHGVKLFGGVEAIKGASTPTTTAAGRRIQGSGINPFSTDLDFVNMLAVGSPTVQSYIYKGVNFSSAFGKLDYNFDEKYYLTGVIRRDGSSVFGENSRYGVFPAVSGAWRVIAEPFMADQNLFDDLKIRGGWGQMGNSNNVDPANQYSLAGKDLGNTIYPIEGQNSGANEGFATSRIGNPDAKWETSTTLNIGFDATILDNHVDVILDWWKKDTEDLLFVVPLPGVTGSWASAPSRNVGAMLNRGVDFQVIGRGSLSDDLSFTVTVNNSFLHNEVVKFADGIDYIDGPSYRGIAPTRNQLGLPLSSFFGYQVLGYFNDAAEVAAAPAQDGKGVGRFRYADINGDGAITPDDRTYLGDPVPEYSGGAVLNLRYKQWSLETYWSWVTGVDIFNQSKWFRSFFGTFEGSAKGVDALTSWTPELGQNATAPIWESATNLSTSGAANSWYVESGDYLRLQRLGLSYNLGSDFLEATGLRKFEIGFSANNIMTLTKYSGLDPVVGGDADTTFGVDVGNYPVTPSYLLNINIGL